MPDAVSNLRPHTAAGDPRPVLRLAAGADAALVFKWRNDPWILSLGTSQRAVTWEEHTAWFASVLDRRQHLLFIIEIPEEGPIGALRLDRAGEDAVMSIYLLQCFTGRGLGPRAIEEGCCQALASWSDLQRLTAHVRVDNKASLRAFCKAGFRRASDEASCADHVLLYRARPDVMISRAWADDDDYAVEHYTQLVERFGQDVRALDWGSVASQRLRFRILADVGNLRGATIVDVGCGQADFLAWLHERGHEVRYWGIDITPAMIATAHHRFPEARLEVRNLLEEPLEHGAADFVLCSGLFTYRRAEPTRFLQRMVELMFQSCRQALAFNCLSAWAPTTGEGEFHADPLETLSFCRSVAGRVVLRHDYHPRDFTVYLYKGKYPG